MTEMKVKQLKRRLQECRYHLLMKYPEFAAPLVDMIYVAEPEIRRASTNGTCIYFDSSWLSKTNDWAIEFMLSHQLMHMELGHLARPKYYKGDRFHFASDVVANSHLFQYGFDTDRLPGVGTIYHQTWLPNVEGNTIEAFEAMKMIPFDPATQPDTKRRTYMVDSDEWWDFPDDRGETGTIVLSPEDKEPDDLILPEEIIIIVEKEKKKKKTWEEKKKTPPGVIEDGEVKEYNFEYEAYWNPDVKETIEDMRSTKERDLLAVQEDNLTERVLRRINKPNRDWKGLLNHFIMVETKDYSFTPPDKRIQESTVFLPDYNESALPQLNVLFLVDSSASVSELMFSMAVSEICSAIEQFNGMLYGRIGFFDEVVRDVHPIGSVERLLNMKPRVAGGTDFQGIFEYVHELSADEKPSEIVVLTDGLGDFPDYSESENIPVLWLVTNDRIHVPWGQVAYFGR